MRPTASALSSRSNGDVSRTPSLCQFATEKTVACGRALCCIPSGAEEVRQPVISRSDGREKDDDWLVRPVKFPLGKLLMTPGVHAQVPPSEMTQALRRHARGDWGDVDPDDIGVNDRSLLDGSRLLSVYKTKTGVKFWIITEADRASTTVLLPDEY